jgi:hypothetical protein
MVIGRDLPMVTINRLGLSWFLPVGTNESPAPVPFPYGPACFLLPFTVLITNAVNVQQAGIEKEDG